MNNFFLFFKRVTTNKIYWLSVLAAFLLLMCSIVYTDSLTGERFIFIDLFYNKVPQEALEFGMISIKGILLGRDTSYLWMFCPIIVGVPCILTQKVERFVLFRTSKNSYFLSKYICNLVLGGVIILNAYLLFAVIGMTLSQEAIWDIYFEQKLASVFCWGMINTIPGILLSEFIHNKYLILCVPFVLNYFVCNFLSTIIPYQIWQYISPENYSMLCFIEQPRIISSITLMIVEIVVCGILIKCVAERRCDCGQK